MVSGKYDLKLSLDDEIDIFVEALNFQGGQYKKMFDKRLDKFCTTLYVDTFKNSYNRFNDASLVKIPFGTCPYPSGKNEINNLMFDDDGLLPPYIPGSEKWKAEIRFLKNEEILGGFNIYAIIRSEQSLMKGV